MTPTHIRRQTVWLSALVRENPLLEGFVFTDCTLVGPMVLAPAGTGTLIDCSFDGASPEEVLITVPDGTRIRWAVGLRDTRLERCRLQGLALVGTADQVARWRDGLTPQGPREGV